MVIAVVYVLIQMTFDGESSEVLRSSFSGNNWLLSEDYSDNNFLDTVCKSWNNPRKWAE